MSDLPAPLVPAEVDLRGLPFMPLDVVRLVDSDLVALSTGEEFKAAVMLWAKCWLQIPAASLPDDDRILAHLSGAGTRWKRTKTMALHGFILCSDGRWYHPVIAEKAAEAWKHRQAQRDRAARRWHGGGNAGADATAPKNDPTGHATAYATAMQGTGTVKGQKVDTEFSLSTELNSETPSPRSGVAARKNSRSRPRQPLPADWNLSEKGREYARSRGWSDEQISHEAEHFRDHSFAHGRLHADVEAAWRTWVQNAPKFAGNSRGNGHVNGTGPATAIANGFAEALAERRAERERNQNSGGGGDPDGDVLGRH